MFLGNEDSFFFSVLYFGWFYWIIFGFFVYPPNFKGYLFGFIILKSEVCLFKKPKELTEKIDLLFINWESIFILPELYFGDILWAYGIDSLYLLTSFNFRFCFYFITLSF